MTSGRSAGAWGTWLPVVACLAGVTIALAARQWPFAALWAVLLVVSLAGLRRNRSAAADRERSSLARSRWTPERVAAELAARGTTSEVQSVKALRQADRDLSLRDAVDLVREVQPRD